MADAGWSEEVGGGRNLARTTAASGGPTPNGGHDSLDLGPPSKRAMAGKVEGDTADLPVRSARPGVDGDDGDATADGGGYAAAESG